ncbi:MAG: acyl-CoA synthetase [Candidatus Bathyarchaeia archaeon]
MQYEVDLRQYKVRSYDELYNQFHWNLPQYFNIGVAVCDRHAEDRGNRVAIFYDDGLGNKDYTTFNALRTKSNQLANLLHELGAKKGDRVGVCLPARPEAVISLIAIYKLGGIALSMSSLFGIDAITYRLRDSQAKILIVEGSREDVRKITGEIPSLKHVIVIEEDRLLTNEVPFNEIHTLSSNFDPVKTEIMDPAQLFYTSGTTGPPKGTLHAHSFLLGHIPCYQLYFNMAPREDDVFWTPADWGWIGALGDVVLPSLYFGMPVVAYRRVGRFEPEEALSIMEEYKVTCAFIPPTALRMIRKTYEEPSKEFDLKLRAISSAGESVGAELVRWGYEKLKVPINEFYGCTEANLVVVMSPDIMKVKPGAMGKPVPGHVVEVIDEAGNVLPPNQIGQIVVKRPDPVMFLEYWNNPEATKKKFMGDWFLMGDLGYKDEDGYIWFKSRADDVIKTAAYRIGPEEVEHIINSHPAVLESAVISKPDPLRGSIIKAFVVVKEGYETSDQLKSEIRQLVKDRLAKYAYPREIEFIDSIPKTVTGKIKRYELRERETRKSLSPA